jgi:FtsZ-binding cell division protein ZapB
MNKVLDDKEAEIKRMEEIMKNAPPKIIDPELRKARDNALDTVRSLKLELGRLKEENIQVLQKLQVAEGIVKESEREKQHILKAQNELKETFVNNLNQQQDKHEKELKEKNERIRELELILNEKMKS